MRGMSSRPTSFACGLRACDSAAAAPRSPDTFARVAGGRRETRRARRRWPLARLDSWLDPVSRENSVDHRGGRVMLLAMRHIAGLFISIALTATASADPISDLPQLATIARGRARIVVR